MVIVGEQVEGVLNDALPIAPDPIQRNFCTLEQKV